MAHIFISMVLLISGLSSTMQQTMDLSDWIEFEEQINGDSIVIEAAVLKNAASKSASVAAFKKLAAKVFTFNDMAHSKLEFAGMVPVPKIHKYMTPHKFQSNCLHTV
ncbi:hypothetical protein J7I93_16175 [Bacillus sp. ISL-47]|uniref:hypothetical protein n=1 Tax=Bacillus sp. ISL-47 TaxID=2819130 RepID=UPI001BECD2DD|nr:hypothetical protein [Bacillus sp. ISL-47]MBT2689725.1 hypothetical protein [Bacillus sp. ISL-47]MBT2709969.1 hypothetical protein [Pseudomonas sp. ISL-84]